MKYLDHKKVKQKRPTELSEKFTNYVDRCNVMQNCWVLLTYTKLLLTGVVDLTGKTWSSTSVSTMLYKLGEHLKTKKNCTEEMVTVIAESYAVIV